MAINKKRDFKKLSACIQEFLSRLPCDESTGFLRDTLYLSLLELHKHYIKVKDRLNSSLRQLNGTLTAVSNERLALDKYECRWHGCEQGSETTKSEGFFAAFQGDTEKLKATVKSDDGDVFGQSYLMYAVQGKSEQLECFNFLLSLKFNINHQANDGRTALHLACQQNQKTSVTSLLNHKANTTIQDKKARTALHWAAINPSSDITKLLLQNGADINSKDCDGMTPVMWACRLNNLENLRVLRNALERVDPRREAIFEDRDDNGETVLHWAVPMRHNNSVECLKDLLVSDVSHIRNNQGRTVLHTAAKEGCVSACELILSTCGKEILHIRDNQNQTALHLATLCGHGETVDYLLQNGANTSDEDSGGRTAIQEAEFGHYHYCLLVFAAFERMKSVEKNKPFTKTPKEDERNDTETRKYESWVIPTGFLNDSQEFPKAAITHDIDPEPQLVDVTEIKGFEVNGDMVSLEYSPSKTSENVTNTKTNHSAPLQRRKRTKENDEQQLIPATNKLNKTEVSSKKNVTVHVLDDNEQLEEEEPQGYSTQYLQQHGSASSLTSNNSASAQEYSISENLEVSSLGNETDEEHSKSEMEYDHSENGPEKNLNPKESEETQEKSDSSIKNTKNKEPTFPNTAEHRVNLTALKPLKQHTLSIPAKLDPIPLPFSTPKNLDNLAQDGKPMQPRGIVAPLQPPVPLGVRHKETLRPLSREKRPQTDTSKTAYYGTRGPEHGPLAHTHGKALLNNVFQPDVPKKKADAAIPESQRRAGRFPHPPKH